jgi:hypothetical protein
MDEYIVLPTWPKHQKWEKAPKIKEGIILSLMELNEASLKRLVEMNYRFDLHIVLDRLSIPYERVFSVDPNQKYPSNYSDTDPDKDTDPDPDPDKDTDPDPQGGDDDRPKLVISLWQKNSGIFNAFSSFKSPNDWKAYWSKSDITKEQIETAFKNYTEAVKSGAIQRRFVPSHVDTFVLNGHIQKSQEPYKTQQTHDPPPETPVYATGKKRLGGLK